MTHIKTLIKSMAIFSLLGLQLASAEVLVIVNKANPVNAISATDLKALYLGKTREFPNDKKATTYNLEYKGKTRDKFERAVLGKSKTAIKRYWSKLIFTGKGKPPKELASDEDMLKRVSSEAGAIGYVDAAAVNGSVKVIFRIR